MSSERTGDGDAFSHWFAGGDLEGVHFAHGERVTVLEGDHAGRMGTVVSLQGLAPEPLYVVALEPGPGEAAVLQSALLGERARQESISARAAARPASE